MTLSNERVSEHPDVTGCSCTEETFFQLCCEAERKPAVCPRSHSGFDFSQSLQYSRLCSLPSCRSWHISSLCTSSFLQPVQPGARFSPEIRFTYIHYMVIKTAASPFVCVLAGKNQMKERNACSRTCSWAGRSLLLP